jgi:hypothetical protein
MKAKETPYLDSSFCIEDLIKIMQHFNIPSFPETCNRELPNLKL